MDDRCIICKEAITTVRFSCGHQNSCFNCSRNMAASDSRNLHDCPVCRRRGAVLRSTDSTHIQVRPTTLSSAMTVCDENEAPYPFGYTEYINSMTIHTPVDRVMIEAIRAAIKAIQSEGGSFDHLKRNLKSRISATQFENLYLELFKDHDLHLALKQLDQRQYETKSVNFTFQSIVRTAVVEVNESAVAYRALFGTIVDGAITCSTHGFTNIKLSSEFGVGSIVLAVFVSIEVYRCCVTREINKETAMVNIGEHVAGIGAGCVGSYGGATIGAYVGTMIFPGPGTTIGTILGSLFAGNLFDKRARAAYRQIFPKIIEENIEETVEKRVQLSALEVATKAAEKIKININVHDYEEAHNRYRKALTATHPDKHPNATPEQLTILNAETVDTIACWGIVRQYYVDKEKYDPTVEENFIRVNVLRTLDEVSKLWKVTRTWVNHLDLGRTINPEKEKLDTMILYM